MKTSLIITLLLCSIVSFGQQITFKKPIKGISYRSINVEVIDSTEKVIDTVYSVADKPFRTIATHYKTPDKKLIAIRVKSVWDEKLKLWIFYSASIAPIENNSSATTGTIYDFRLRN